LNGFSDPRTFAAFSHRLLPAAWALPLCGRSIGKVGGCVSEGAVDLLRHDFDKNGSAKMAKKQRE